MNLRNLILTLSAAANLLPQLAMSQPPPVPVTPVLVTQAVAHDTDDPAIWIHPTSPESSLIIGTDKGDDGQPGGLYVFNLAGEIQSEKCILNLPRPNNVDVAYGLTTPTGKVDVAVCTVRDTHCLRIFALPSMKPVDGGGIPVFESQTQRSPMGIALYQKSPDELHAIVSRKDGPTDGSYLWQYRLAYGDDGIVRGTLLRKFGNYSGEKEIESVAVDSELGYVYYSDETLGVRKYFADPDKGNAELACFATEGFAGDREGISIYTQADGQGYIAVSDQQANRFHIFTRSGPADQPHRHSLVKKILLSTDESDGSDVTHIPVTQQFPNGLFVAMSSDRTFHFYSWSDFSIPH